MNALRVHFDHQVFSLQNNGGNSRYHFELLRQLKRDLQVSQELFLGLHQTQLPFSELAGDNVRVVGRASSLPPGRRRYVVNEFLNNVYAASRGRFDIYHPTHHRLLPMVRARRIVATHHDCTAEKFPEDFRFHGRVRRAKESLFSRADAIICISEASRRDLLDFYAVDPARTVVVHHGLTPLQRAPEAAIHLRRLLRREYVVFVGWRVGYKNFRGLLRAFRDSGLHRSLDLLVLGGAPISPEEERLISDLGLGPNVIVTGFVTDALLAEAYAAARLLAYPSRSEGFGFPPLEAMNLGCPVLACYASSSPEVYGDAPFYFDPDSQESLIEALRTAACDETARAHSVAKGKQIAAKYSWEKCAAETLAVYRESL